VISHISLVRMLKLVSQALWGGSSRRVTKSPIVDFGSELCRSEHAFTERVQLAEKHHGRGLRFAFTDDAIGRTRALYVGSLNGHYWGHDSIIDYNNVTDFRAEYSLVEFYSMEDDPPQRLHSLPTTVVWFQKPGSAGGAMHYHFSSDDRGLSETDLIHLQRFWRKEFNRTLSGVVTVYYVKYSMEVQDLRDVLRRAGNGIRPYDIPHSVSTSCEPHVSFMIGSTFRQHGRSRQVAFLALQVGQVTECKQSPGNDSYRPSQGVQNV